jgi:hypothetical protein
VDDKVDGMAVAYECASDAYEQCLRALEFVRDVEDWGDWDTVRFDFAIAVLREWQNVFQDKYDTEMSRVKREAKDV